MDENTIIADLKGRFADANAAHRHVGERTAADVEPARIRLNAFLVRFQEVVRGSLDPKLVAAAACRLVAEELGVDRAYWSEVDWTTREFVIGAEFHAPDVAPVSGRFPMDGWEPFSSYHPEGRPVVVYDTANDPRITPDLLKGYQALGIQADLAVPVLAGDKLRSVLALNQSTHRKWTLNEVTLVQTTAEWCWAEVERARAETALRESEERQAFLLKLSDALRPLADSIAIKEETARVLGKHLCARRVFYAEVEGGDWLIEIGYEQTDGPRAEGRMPVDAFGRWVIDLFRRGQRLVACDLETDARFDPLERAAYGTYEAQAIVALPLVKKGEMVALLAVHNATSRAWTDLEVALVEETAERTWAAIERARAEAALRKSEERFRQFADASAAGLWIRNAATLAMEFASPAVSTIYGVEASILHGDVRRWAAMIVPEDRAAASTHLDAARRGEIAIHEFRIQRPIDQAFRWIRNTAFPLWDNDRILRVGGIAEDVTEAKLAVEHQGVLLAELQHRVRNMMGIIRSLANRTAAGAKDVADYRVLLEGRLLALARVQALLTREANTGGSLRSVLESEIAAQAHHGDQYALTGPDIMLSPKAVEVLTLAFHELSTNALKYGALSVPEGHLTVAWKPFDKRGRTWLALDWAEQGAPPRSPAIRRGFGSELIEARIPYELGGLGTVTTGPEGARCHLEFPLREAESILETDAPRLTTTFGGSLDMTGAPDLTGRTILVVEDDYYLATDTAAALRGAGAKVLGPCPSEDTTRNLLADETPTHAILDLDLGGGGPQFEIARLLQARGVPFVFLTGYDPDVIPDDLADVVRLQKPLPFRHIVEAVSQL